MTEPKYKVGDTLTHVAFPELTAFVVEVITQTCPGGMQVHYVCRASQRRIVGDSYVKFNESEMMPAKPKQIADAFDGWLSCTRSSAVESDRLTFGAAVQRVRDLLKEVPWTE